ncbi:MAG: DUF1702 family protein [Crocinitomicaceae bacterium]
MTVEERIYKLQEAFQIGKLEGELSGIKNEYHFETSLSNEYTSVAFEGCSMSIAMTSIKNRDSLIDWHLFSSTKGKNYLSQIHIGLGWALAELQLPTQQYLISIDPKWQLRVLDGFGYYSGLFRRREAIRNMSFPTQIPEELYAGYNQGIGRFLYYLAHGDVERLERNIELFPNHRHSDFWRGIGIAATFIGGLNEKSINRITQSSGKHEKQFMIGVELATNSLKKAAGFDENSEKVRIGVIKGKSDFMQHIQDVETKHYATVELFLAALNA